MRIAALVGSMFAVLLLVAVPARAGTRVALVIGNGAYQNVPFLPTPTNDAADLSASLGRLGFDVKTLTNARYDDLRRALSDFDQQARGAEFALIFFAGHGFQIGGENWLIPVDAQLAIDLDVVNETIGLHSLMRSVSNASKLGLVILDASRNDPFRAKMQSTNLSRAVERGFSRVEPSDNVLVAYAARDGTTASDGSGRNSPFTSSLLKNIESSGLEVRSLFANIRDDVMAATKQEQQPFVYGSLSKDQIYLALPPQNSQAPLAETPRRSEEELFWTVAKDSKNVLLLDQFLRKYPLSSHAAEAMSMYRARGLPINEYNKLLEMLFKPTYQGGVIGNPNGDKAFVLLTDFNDGYMQRALTGLFDLISEDSNVKVIVREFPVLGDASWNAASVSVALRMQDVGGTMYFEFLKRINAMKGMKDKGKAMDAARLPGVDMQKLAKDSDSAQTKMVIQEAIQLGEKLGINGVPAYAIGNGVVIGVLDLEALKNMLSSVRTGTTSK